MSFGVVGSWDNKWNNGCGFGKGKINSILKKNEFNPYKIDF